MSFEVIFMYSFNGKTFAPSLVNNNGTLVAAMCKGVTGKKWGYIEIVTMRSADAGKTWGDEVVAIAPPARTISEDENNTKSAFFLNPVLAAAPNGDLVMLVTFYPESQGSAKAKDLEKKKTAFTYFDGVYCPIVYDRDKSFYILMTDGAVVDKTKARTAFTVKGIGDLYQGEEYVGNIYLNGAKGKSEGEEETTFGSVLKSPKRSYIFALTSSDNGLTWSEPVNITGNIFAANDGAILETANGNAVVTSTGRIIVPLKTGKKSVAIYSDDNGITWHRNSRMLYTATQGDWTAFQTSDNKVQGFAGKKSASSSDNGINWDKGIKLPKLPKKSLKSAAALGDSVFVTAPTGKKGGGSLTIGDSVFNKKGKYKGIKWRKAKTPITDGTFAASSITPITANSLGVMFEDGDKVNFTLINVE